MINNFYSYTALSEASAKKNSIKMLKLPFLFDFSTLTTGIRVNRRRKKL